MNGTRNRTARRPSKPFDIPARVAARAAERFFLATDTGCHISTYSVASHGYAQLGWKDGGGTQVVGAHRAAWVWAHGQIPAGMTIDHTCKEKRCVRADHLRLLDNYENARRTSGRDWPIGQCINGHPNSELRLVREGDRQRLRCPKCAAIYRARYSAKLRRAA